MPDDFLTHPLFILVIGVAMVLAMLIKAGLERIGLPALVGYLALGLGIRLANDAGEFLNESGWWSFELLAELGVICILFRVGLENDPKQLFKQLPNAVSIWIGNVALPAILGYVAARYVLGFELPASLFVATALSATSVGVSVLIWEDAGHLKSPLGRQLIDVAELDDVSAVVFMVGLFAAAPLLREGTNSLQLSAVLARATGVICLKALLLGGLCFGFARLVEKRMTAFFARFERAPDPMIAVVGVGFVIASIGNRCRTFDGREHGPAGGNCISRHADGQPTRRLGGARHALRRNGHRLSRQLHHCSDRLAIPVPKCSFRRS